MDELNINEILARMYYAKGDEKAVFVITDLMEQNGVGRKQERLCIK